MNPMGELEMNVLFFNKCLQSLRFLTFLPLKLNMNVNNSQFQVLQALR